MTETDRHEVYQRNAPLVERDLGLSHARAGLLGTARRSVFIVDPQGVIRYSKEEPLSLSYRSVDDILNALQESGLLTVQGE